VVYAVAVLLYSLIVRVHVITMSLIFLRVANVLYVSSLNRNVLSLFLKVVGNMSVDHK